MKDQNITIVILIFIVISLTIFFLQIFNNNQFVFFEKNIRNFEKIGSMDQMFENYLKSSLRDLFIVSIYESAESSFGKTVWDAYPRCLLTYIPSVNEIKSNIENKINNNLYLLKNFIDILNMLLFFYPFKVVLKINNAKYSVLVDQPSVLNGLYDYEIPIEIDNITVEIFSPFSIIKKSYKLSYKLENIRLFYIYRKIYDWIDSREYQRLVGSYSKDLFVCKNGYTISNRPDYGCNIKKKIICNGELVKKVYKYVISKRNVLVCTESEKERIRNRNEQVENTCPVDSTFETIDCKNLICNISYDKLNICMDGIDYKNEESLSFAVGGGGTINPPQPPGGANCEIIEESSCDHNLILEEPIGQSCTITQPVIDLHSIKSFINCQRSLSCPSRDEILLVAEKIKVDLENSLNSLFSPTDQIFCKVDLFLFNYNCDVSTIDEILDQRCSCLTREGTKSVIVVSYNISCVDKKFYNFINNKIENLKVNFVLGIFGQSICDPSSVQVDLSNIQLFCCDVIDFGSHKDCCLGVDNNGNCINCPQSTTYVNADTSSNVLCIS